MSYLVAQADAVRLPLLDRSVDLVFGSPPYCDARTYGISAQRGCREWVEWMLGVTTEAVRVSKGLVLWVCAGVTRDHCYWPACEGLLWEWWRGGGQCWRPAFWHRVGIPGSGGKKWLRADVEYVLCFKRPGNDFWTDNTAMGKPPKWDPGGAMSYRGASGQRKNAFGVRTDTPIGTRKTGRKRAEREGYRAANKAVTRRQVGNGERSDDAYIPPVKANPGNIIKTHAGMGHTGHKLAHENEAPFAEDLAAFFIRTACPEGGICLDPLSGSGTTASIAERWGRYGIGCDLRRSQCEISRKRIEAQRPSLFDALTHPAAPPLAAVEADGDAGRA